ncbi:hypothetical protein MJO28_017707 [Puccinia striiformis f. sp. tritici]|nr:hypothetical protein MJO28_017707 [Puccinia striiformis f. sp. tritici]
MNGLDDDLLDRLDNGLIDNSNEEEFKLNELDSKNENSIELNQSYSNHIKATLDHLNTLHDKAQTFLVSLIQTLLYLFKFLLIYYYYSQYLNIGGVQS